MRLLIFGDLQATDGGEVCFHDPSLKLQDWRVGRFLRLLHKLYKENQCDGLIDLGDTTDDRSAIPVPTINTLFRCLSKFPEDAYNIKLIGNHEQYTRNASIDVGAMFRPFFDVFSTPNIIEHPDCDFVLAPYPRSHDELEAWIKAEGVRQPRKRPRVLLGHFQAVGSTTRGGTLMEGVSRAALEPYDLVLLGHIHKPQQFMPNGYYVGSPFQQNWGESGEEKRVGLLDTRTLDIEWIPLEGFPTYRTVTLEEFVQAADPKSEDRYEVVIRNSAEATTLYNHPQANRVRPRYDFGAHIGEITEDARPCWDAGTTMKRYLGKYPWETELTEEGMLATGLEIIGKRA